MTDHITGANLPDHMTRAHLPLVPQCGACGHAIYCDEMSIAMLGNDDASGYSGHTTPKFPFPRNQWNQIQIDGRQPCRYSRRRCQQCRRAPTVVAVHYDCFHIFRRGFAFLGREWDERDTRIVEEDGLLDKLWTIGAWRRPWPYADAVYLEDAGPASHNDAELAAFTRMAAVAGLPQLNRLPLEVKCIVHSFSAHSFFWRAIRCLGARAMHWPDGVRCRIPLNNIVSWKRGHSLSQTDMAYPPCLAPPPIIRITFDRQGIVQIERLDAMPVYRNQTTTHSAFIVENVDLPENSILAKTHIEIKHGLVRLNLPSKRDQLRIWNASSPPDISACTLVDPVSFRRILTLRRHIPSKFYAVDINHSFGLTFLFTAGVIYGVHVHRTAYDSAVPTYNHLTANTQETVVWVFLPVTPNDRIVALWVCSREHIVSLIARMELAGDVVLGHASESARALLLAHGERLTLVYGKSSEDRSVKIIGGYSYSSDTGRDAPSNGNGDAHANRDIRHVRPPAIVSMPTKLTTQSPDDTYTSSAPLHGVVSVEVFHVPAMGICRGLLLRYANGSVRALGECRVSHDESFVVVDPAAICHRSLQYQSFEREARFSAIVPSVVRKLEMKLEGVAVSVARTTQHSHNEDGWTCHNIGQGVLHFHYTEKHDYAIAYEAEDRFRHAV